MFDFDRFIFVTDSDCVTSRDTLEAIFDALDECDMFYCDDARYDGYLIDTVEMTVKKASFGVKRTSVIEVY